MGRAWGPDPDDQQPPAPPREPRPRRRRRQVANRPKFGPDTVMTFVLDAARDVDVDRGLRTLHERYPKSTLAEIHDYLIRAHQLLEDGQIIEAERLAHEFAVTADRANAKPDATNRPVPAPRRAFLRLKGWLHR